MTEERALLTDIWMEKVRSTFETYKRARDFRQHAQDEAPHLPQADGGFAFRRALIAETAALTEYSRALETHHNLIVKGERPNENHR